MSDIHTVGTALTTTTTTIAAKVMLKRAVCVCVRACKKDYPQVARRRIMWYIFNSIALDSRLVCVWLRFHSNCFFNSLSGHGERVLLLLLLSSMLSAYSFMGTWLDALSDESGKEA